MLTASQAAVAAYVHAMLQGFVPASLPGRKLVEWIYHNQGMIDLDFQEARLRACAEGSTPEELDFEKPVSPALWAELCAVIGRTACDAPAESDQVTKNVAAFAAAVGLDPIEAAIFRFVYMTDCDNRFNRLCGRIVGTRAVDTISLVSRCIAAGVADIQARLSRGPLRALHLIGMNNEFADYFAWYVPHRVVNALMPPSNGLADIEARLIGAPLPGYLASADYAHIARERDFVLRLLAGAVKERRKGVNILIHGAPGTGKSEFAKMVAEAIGCTLFSVGEADEDGGEPSRWDRIDSLRLADRLANGRGKTLLLFDEMEDILARGERTSSVLGPVRRAGSKVFFNRMLEQNQVPVLWVANTICEFDPAFLRRMTFAFEMKPLPSKARAGLWEGFARNQGLDLPPQEAETLARRHKVAPALMTSAIQAVAMAGGEAGDLDFVVGALSHPFVRRGSEVTQAGAGFDTELANADIDLARLQRALSAPQASRNVTLCFYGPPGTGKSAFARRLAEAMGLDPLVKRGSDLLSKWIGETERNLARAFEEARDDSAFLIIDEAEGFLWSRAGAERSWEVSMVNELLVQMENHSLPFACTTNHLDRIDPAALRRFAFKVKFDFMRPVQADAAYRRFFDLEPPATLRSLQHLTPGDFAVVARKLRFMGGLDETLDPVKLLSQEVEAKNLPVMKIGF